MRRSKAKLIVSVSVLLAFTLAALAISALGIPSRRVAAQPAGAGSAHLTVSGHLVQDKILKNGNGQVDLVLTLQGHAQTGAARPTDQPVDLVVVLDRSGSMAGPKIADAKRAVTALVRKLGPRDRFALISYADAVRHESPLSNVNDGLHQNLNYTLKRLLAGGSTNLGGGLVQGVQVLSRGQRRDAQKRLILISDGRANRGMTGVNQLSQVAAKATEGTISISTVGVGHDFNEKLMTAIADNGAGVYYYLEDPQVFADIFREELQRGRRAVATALEVRLPLANGMRLTEAAGFPVTHRNGEARFYPGNVHAGQERRLFLKLQVPAHRIGEYALGPVSVKYHQDGITRTARIKTPLTLACIEDPRKVYEAIDKHEWEEKVLDRDYGRLQTVVADDISKGDHKAAIKKIEAYKAQNRAVNQHVGSRRVAEALETRAQSLKDVVEETFQGAPAAVAGKQKANAKALQYEGYQIQRQHKVN